MANKSTFIKTESKYLSSEAKQRGMPKKPMCQSLQRVNTSTCYGQTDRDVISMCHPAYATDPKKVDFIMFGALPFNKNHMSQL